MSIPQPNPGTQSLFVTILAWIFIVLSGFAVFIAVVQNIAIYLLFPSEQFQQLFGHLKIQQQQLPPLAQFLFSNVRWIFAGFLLLSTAAFVASVGLLQRARWARLVFVALMGLGIAGWVAGVVIQYTVLTAMMPLVPAGAPDEFQSHWEWMRMVAMAFSTSMAIVSTMLFGWIIRRLLSPAIREEFLFVPLPAERNNDD